MMSKKAPRRFTSCNSRASVDARSKRNPSTCISFDPIAQAVHDKLQHPWMIHIQRIAAASVIHVVALVVVDETVVRRVIDPTEAERRAELVAFRGMVVHHVENHLDTLAVQRLHHRLEFAHLFAAFLRVRVADVGRRKTRSSYSPNSS